MYRTRDWRRAQRARYIKRVIRAEKVFDVNRDIPNPLNNHYSWVDVKGNKRFFQTWQDVFELRAQRAAYRADNRAKCSCYMCGNPRRYYNEKTFQEQRFESSYKIED